MSGKFIMFAVLLCWSAKSQAGLLLGGSSNLNSLNILPNITQALANTFRLNITTQKLTTTPQPPVTGETNASATESPDVDSTSEPILAVTTQLPVAVSEIPSDVNDTTTVTSDLTTALTNATDSLV